MGSLWFVQLLANRSQIIDRLIVKLGGSGGEVARGKYLDACVLMPTSTQRSVISYLARRLVDDHGGLIRPAAVALARDHMVQFCAEMARAGFKRDDLPDACFVYNRYRRWAGTLQRASSPIGDEFHPLCTRAFVEMSFSLPPGYRYRGYLPVDTIRTITPHLASLPFDKRGFIALRVFRDLARRVAMRLPRPSRGQRGHQSAIQAQWLEHVAPRIREISFSQPHSLLWDLVDRRVFERATQPSTSCAERAHRATGLYQVATLGYYLASQR